LQICQRSPNGLNASHRWVLNAKYFKEHEDVNLEMEATRLGSNGSKEFTRNVAPLSLFTQWATTHLGDPLQHNNETTKLYIAQSALGDLPLELQVDVATPSLVQQLGKGDIYGSSLWMGIPPTSTPLHRDPNPNLFVQLVGRKRIRLMPPSYGDAVFAAVKQGNGRIRNEQMMVGEEGTALEDIVWQSAEMADSDAVGVMFEAVVDGGDGVFIPKGWWHAVKGEGEGINASVSNFFNGSIVDRAATDGFTGELVVQMRIMSESNALNQFRYLLSGNKFALCVQRHRRCCHDAR